MQPVQPPTPSFDEMFPTIARWISQEEGWVELGADHGGAELDALEAEFWDDARVRPGTQADPPIRPR